MTSVSTGSISSVDIVKAVSAKDRADLLNRVRPQVARWLLDMGFITLEEIFENINTINKDTILIVIAEKYFVNVSDMLERHPSPAMFIGLIDVATDLKNPAKILQECHYGDADSIMRYLNRGYRLTLDEVIIAYKYLIGEGRGQSLNILIDDTRVPAYMDTWVEESIKKLDPLILKTYYKRHNITPKTETELKLQEKLSATESKLAATESDLTALRAKIAALQAMVDLA